MASSSDKYIALARRYRPTAFEDVIGQQHVTRTLQNAIVANRVHHAYLFTGSRGIGKTTVARILARALNHPDGPTPNPPPPEDAEAEIRYAVDVLEIDGASHTGVDDVRELRENVRYLPANARHKIIIIDEVHMLSTSAFNALLKTLEEPPPHVVFVFATTEPHKIPATILSRCQRFDFKRVPSATIVAHLEHLLQAEKVAVEHAGLALIARAAEGGVRDALSLLDQVIAYAASGDDETIPATLIAEVLGVADRRVLFELSGAILARDADRALSIVDRLFADGQDMSQFAQAFVMHLRDLVVVATCDKPEPLVEATDSEMEELRAQGQRDTGALLQLLFERFVQAAEQLARSSFPRLLLEMAVIELAQMEPLLPLGDLLQRLENLERHVSASSGGSEAVGGSGSQRASGVVPSTAPPKQSDRPRATAPASEAAPDTPSSDPNAAAGSATVSTEAPARQLEPEDVHARWRALLGQLRGPSVGIFAAGKLVGWEGDRIELAFEPDGFELHGAEDQTRRESFIQAASKQLGRPIRLSVRALTDQDRNAPDVVRQSAIEAREHEQRAHTAELREEALAHPITRALIQELGAKVKQVATETDRVER